VTVPSLFENGPNCAQEKVSAQLRQCFPSEVFLDLSRLPPRTHKHRDLYLI